MQEVSQTGDDSTVAAGIRCCMAEIPLHPVCRERECSNQTLGGEINRTNLIIEENVDPARLIKNSTVLERERRQYSKRRTIKL